MAMDRQRILRRAVGEKTGDTSPIQLGWDEA
jgi:hypothetical protein